MKLSHSSTKLAGLCLLFAACGTAGTPSHGTCDATLVTRATFSTPGCIDLTGAAYIPLTVESYQSQCGGVYKDAKCDSTKTIYTCKWFAGRPDEVTFYYYSSGDAQTDVDFVAACKVTCPNGANTGTPSC